MKIKIEGFEFHGPYFHDRKFVNDFPCVYVLLNNKNQIIDVGETESVNSRIPNHDRKTCWIVNGCKDSGLFIYISNDTKLRLLLERLIRLKYSPVCGTK